MNPGDTTVLIIGGKKKDRLSESTGARYFLESNTLDENIPMLNIARCGAGGCYLGGFVYIFAGKGTNDVLLNSIEKLNVNALSTS